MKRRYSYSWTNAARFLPIYDSIIEQVKSRNPVIGITIPRQKIETHYTMSLHTFQQRLGDGLKFLAERYGEVTSIDLKYNQDEYILLKAMFKTACETDYILIGVKQAPTFFSSVKAQMSKYGADGVIISALKQQVLDFLQDKDKPVIQIKDISQPVSKEDIDWLYNEIQQSLGMALVWAEENKSLTIVK